MDKVPYHLGIIIDANRRWARERNLPGHMGHIAGREKVKEVCRWCKEIGIKIITIYAFSTENWNRPRGEVEFLLGFTRQALVEDMREVHREGFKIKVIGQKERLPESLQKAINEAENLTKDNKEGTLVLAISYGGRAEILEAVRNIARRGFSHDEISEVTIEQNLWTAGIPDPDLIIRTGGEKRLSGFLLWQSVYSELIFLDVYWPDFSRDDFLAALKEYAGRQRRFGK